MVIVLLINVTPSSVGYHVKFVLWFLNVFVYSFGNWIAFVCIKLVWQLSTCCYSLPASHLTCGKGPEFTATSSVTISVGSLHKSRRVNCVWSFGHVRMWIVCFVSLCVTKGQSGYGLVKRRLILSCARERRCALGSAAACYIYLGCMACLDCDGVDVFYVCCCKVLICPDGCGVFVVIECCFF